MPANLSFGLNVLKVTPFIWIYVVFVGNFQVYVIWSVLSTPDKTYHFASNINVYNTIQI